MKPLLILGTIAAWLQMIHLDQTGAVKVKAIGEVADKWVEVTPMRATYYLAGASVAGSDWEKGAMDAASAYKAAVTNPNIDKMFSGGVKKAGGEKYERKVKEVGSDRFSTGVLAAKSDYSSGMEPMLSTIASVTLPARQPRGSAANLARVSAIADALHKKRLALRAAGA